MSKTKSLFDFWMYNITDSGFIDVVVETSDEVQLTPRSLRVIERSAQEFVRNSVSKVEEILGSEFKIDPSKKVTVYSTGSTIIARVPIVSE